MSNLNAELQILTGADLNVQTQSDILTLQKIVTEQEILTMGIQVNAELTATDFNIEDNLYFLDYRLLHHTKKAPLLQLVGFLCLERLTQNEYAISRLLIHPQQFGHGLSSALLRAALQYINTHSAVIVDNDLPLWDYIEIDLSLIHI